MRYLFAIVLLLAAGIGAYFALDSVLWQHAANTRFVPVDCQIQSAQVEAHRGKSTSYSPEATYRYQYQGTWHTSSRVLPFSEQSNRSWAQETLRPFVPGLKATAYVNPDNPDEAILVRAYSLTPYVLSMITLMAVGIALGLLTNTIGAGRTTMTAVPMDAEGRHLLLPTRSNRRALVDATCWFAWSALVIGTLFAHWLLAMAMQAIHGTISLSMSQVLVWTAAAAFLALLAFLLVRRWLVARHVSDARVLVKPAPLVRGQPFDIAVEMDAYSPLRVQQLRATVICTEHYKEKRGNKTSYGTRKRGELAATLRGPGDVPAGQLVEGQGQLLFPTDQFPPTTDLVIKTYPHYTWELTVTLQLEGMVDYAARFPLQAD